MKLEGDTDEDERQDDHITIIISGKTRKNIIMIKIKIKIRTEQIILMKTFIHIRFQHTSLVLPKQNYYEITQRTSKIKC